MLVDITPEKLEFSRIAAQAAAQTIKQQIKKELLKEQKSFITTLFKKSEEKVNSMSHEEFCDEMIKFGLEAKKVGGVKNLVFRDIQ